MAPLALLLASEHASRITGQTYPVNSFETAVEQLTLLWANALGIREVPSRRISRGVPK